MASRRSDHSVRGDMWVVNGRSQGAPMPLACRPLWPIRWVCAGFLGHFRAHAPGMSSVVADPPGLRWVPRPLSRPCPWHVVRCGRSAGSALGSSATFAPMPLAWGLPFNAPLRWLQSVFARATTSMGSQPAPRLFSLLWGRGYRGPRCFRSSLSQNALGPEWLDAPCRLKRWTPCACSSSYGAMWQLKVFER